MPFLFIQHACCTHSAVWTNVNLDQIGEGNPRKKLLELTINQDILSLHKKWSSPLKISSIKVAKSAWNYKRLNTIQNSNISIRIWD